MGVRGKLLGQGKETYRVLCDICRTGSLVDSVWELGADLVDHGLDHVVDPDRRRGGEFVGEVGEHGFAHCAEADEADGLERG